MVSSPHQAFLPCSRMANDHNAAELSWLLREIWDERLYHFPDSRDLSALLGGIKSIGRITPEIPAAFGVDSQVSYSPRLRIKNDDIVSVGPLVETDVFNKMRPALAVNRLGRVWEIITLFTAVKSNMEFASVVVSALLGNEQKSFIP